MDREWREAVDALRRRGPLRMEHEAMRVALCGSTSGVWRKHPQCVAILAATIPSGIDGVVEVRSQINACCFGPGFRPLSSAPPSVVHCPKLAGCLPHNHIFIGFGSASRQPSQFLNVSHTKCCNFCKEH